MGIPIIKTTRRRFIRVAVVVAVILIASLVLPVLLEDVGNGEKTHAAWQHMQEVDRISAKYQDEPLVCLDVLLHGYAQIDLQDVDPLLVEHIKACCANFKNLSTAVYDLQAAAGDINMAADGLTALGTMAAGDDPWAMLFVVAASAIGRSAALDGATHSEQSRLNVLISQADSLAEHEEALAEELSWRHDRTFIDLH